MLCYTNHLIHIYWKDVRVAFILSNSQREMEQTVSSNAKSGIYSFLTVICSTFSQVLGTIFFLTASVLYKPPPQSPQSSCESTDHGVGDVSDLPVKGLPEDGVIVNLHARL